MTRATNGAAAIESGITVAIVPILVPIINLESGISTIMSIMSTYGIPARDYFGWQVPNGCGYHICISERNWKLGRREAFMESEINVEHA